MPRTSNGSTCASGRRSGCRLPTARSTKRARCTRSIFWPSVEAGAAELRRVPGGRVALAMRMQQERGGPFNPSRFGLSEARLAEISRSFEGNGFGEIAIERRDFPRELVAVLLAMRLPQSRIGNTRERYSARGPRRASVPERVNPDSASAPRMRNQVVRLRRPFRDQNCPKTQGPLSVEDQIPTRTKNHCLAITRSLPSCAWIAPTLSKTWKQYLMCLPGPEVQSSLP